MDRGGYFLVEREERGHGSNLARLETASELNKKLLTLNLSSRRLYKLQAKISGHAVNNNLLLNTQQGVKQPGSKIF